MTATATGNPDSFDLVVIGAGPGGYVAAIRAAQLGLRAAVVERDALGGICLNWGCIPTKALLKSAEVLETCKKAADFGVLVKNLEFDFKVIIDRSRKVAATMERGVTFLFKKNKIPHIPGTARLTGKPGTVEVTGPDGGKRMLTARHIIVATGARARSLPGITPDGKRIITYREAMVLPQQPRSMIILGAGAIGVEFASFYRSLGTEVTLVEYMPTVVPLEDHEVADVVTRAFKKRGMQLLTATKVTGARATDAGVEVMVEDAKGGNPRTLTADVALVAIGIQPNTQDLGLEAAGVKLDPKGYIVIDDRTLATSAPGVYAIGDVTGPPALAHTASQEGVNCVELLAGLKPQPIDYERIIACTFCHPEIGSIGYTEARAKAEGKDYKVGRFPFRANGKAVAAADVEGMVKVIFDAKHGELLGAHIVGPGATDLIAEMGLLHGAEATSYDVMATIHAHPTLAEALKEAVEDAYGHAIHI
ncbi:MAG: dihydrolipoyl dehydrogenase [Deltaproteobacteria bacterium]|nr:dihydrolipoyl dehydrogenase [Deltaproteobacteria bacterium]